MNEDGDASPIKTKGFSFKAKNVGLTYAQCHLKPDIFAMLLLSRNPGKNCDKYVIGAERHADGGEHYHVYMHFPKKIHTKNPRYFDLILGEDWVAHPNIMRFKGQRADPEIDRWISYCKKGGLYDQSGFLENLFTFKHWVNYRKNKGDLEAWERDAKAQQLVNPFPFDNPDGSIVDKPVVGPTGHHNKKRHWLWHSPPDYGKSFYFMSELSESKTYWRPNNEYPYEADSYRGQQIIIIDDFWPKLEEILDITAVWSMEKQVYGKSRYRANYWPKNQARVIIWLLNEDKMPDYTKAGNKGYPAFAARFNVRQFPDLRSDDEKEETATLLLGEPRTSDTWYNRD